MPEDTHNLTYEEAAKILGRSERQVQRYVKEGRLTRHPVMSQTGQRIYFSETEVKKLKRELQEPGRGDKGGDTSSQRMMALQTAIVGMQSQLDKKDQQLEKKEETINKLNRELGGLVVQVKDRNKLAEKSKKLGQNLKQEQQEKTSLKGEIGNLRKSHGWALLTINLIYIIAILIAGTVVFLPQLQQLLGR